MECPVCGATNDADSSFCRRCGHALQPAPAGSSPSSGVTCPACGVAVGPGTRFCPSCGAPLVPEPASLTPAAGSPPAESSAPTPAAVSAPDARATSAPSPPVSAPVAVSPPPSAEDVSVYIGGEVTGQVAIGNNILQIGSIHGGVVNIRMPEQQPRPRPRATPPALRPRPFPNLLDREAEISAAASALQSVTPVEVYGQAGLGKTALLRHLAHHSVADAFPDGVVYLSARGQPVADLFQSLFDAFYEIDVPGGMASDYFKPTDAQVRQALQGKRAFILLDDLELARDEVQTILDAAPTCSFLLAASERSLWGDGSALGLRGLCAEDGIALIEREMGRPVAEEERAAAQSLCAALDGHPLRILQAAAMTREEGIALAEVLGRVQAPAPAEALAAQLVAALSDPEQRILAALAAVGGGPLPTEHIADLAKLPQVVPVLESLQQRGLVQAHSPRYSLTGALGETLRQAWDLTPWAERALAHFATWAEGQRDAPDRLLEAADAILQALEWAVKAGHWREVLHLGRAMEGALALGGRWGAWARVLGWLLQAARALGDRAVEAWAFHQLGTRALCLGETTAARTSLTKALRLRDVLGDRAGAAVTRHNLGLILGPPGPPEEPPEPPAEPPAGPPVSPPAAGLPVPLIAAGSVLSLAAVGAVAWVLWDHVRPGPTPATSVVETVSPTHIGTPSRIPVTPSPTPVMSSSTPVTPSPTPDTEGPDAPELVAPEHEASMVCGPDDADHLVKCLWDAVSDPYGIERYEVYLEALEREPRAYPVAFSEETALEMVVPCDEAYLWRVRAVDGAGNEGAWSEERLFLVQDTTGPPAPRLIVPADGAELACSTDPVDVTLGWSAVEDPSGVSGYFVELEGSPSGMPDRPTVVPVQIGPVNATSLETALDCGTDYVWRVRALDGAANVGDWSSEMAFSVLAPPVPDLVVANLQTTGPASIAPDGSVEVPVRVRVGNRGNGMAGTFKVSTEYTGPDGTYTVAFTVPGQDSAWYPDTDTPLAAGDSVTFEGIVVFPSSEQGETVYLTAVADSCAGDELMPAYCRVDEDDEGNNESAPVSLALPARLSVQLTPVADTYIDSSGGYLVNFGDKPTLNVDSYTNVYYETHTYRTLMRFSLSAISDGATIEGATLRLYLTEDDYDEDAIRIGLVRVLGEWTELGVNWTNQPPTAWPDFQDSIIVGDSSGYYSWGLTSLVQAWVNGETNYGVMLIGKETPDVNGWRAFASRESNDAPQLLVEYTTP